MRTGREINGIEQHLGGQAPGQGVRVVDSVILVPFVGGDGELVGPALADGFDHVLHVESAFDEFLSQPIEEFGVGGRVAGANVVKRLDDPDAEQVAPQTVYVAFGEVLIVSAGHPGGQSLAAAGLFHVDHVLGFKGELGRGNGAGTVVF